MVQGFSGGDVVAQNETQFLHEILMGNHEAVRLCQLFARVSQVLDDLIDKDKPVPDEVIVKSYWDCLIEVPSNTFYQQNFGNLQPIVRQVLIDWLDATALEKGGDHEKNIAFVLRSSLESIVIQSALILGGYEWVRKVSLKVREFVFTESLKDYKEAL
jgi:hypothetical protein